MPMIHAASHVNHEKGVVWFSISMYACGSLPIAMVLHLEALQIVEALLYSILMIEKI